jgi:hypothetical protein
MSEGMQKISKELVCRYGVLPILPFEDVWIDKCSRIFLVRISNDSGKPDNYKIETKRAKSNCKHCYGFGYENIFYSNEERFQGHPLLTLCRCLKHDLKAQAIYDKSEEKIIEETSMLCEICQQNPCTCNILKTSTALPKLQASADFRKVEPSGESSAQASIHDIIRENTIGEDTNV